MAKMYKPYYYVMLKDFSRKYKRKYKRKSKTNVETLKLSAKL